MTDKKKPTLTVVSDKSNPPTSGAGNTGTNTGAKTTRGKPYKGQPKAGSVKTPVNSEGLTVKQEAFCIAILNGTGWSDAYREAYDAENMAPATVHREAYALATNHKIAARLERAEREKQQEQRMQRLSLGQSAWCKSWSRSPCARATLTAHRCGRWNCWARRWGCSSTRSRQRTRQCEMLMQCGLNWRRG